MNHKIIGFTVSPYEIDHGDVDVFAVGLSTQKLKYADFFVYIWGIGDLTRCFLQKDTFTLSFPLTDSLEDRNVLVRLKDNRITVENDWLGSIPVFYHAEMRTVSTLMNKIVDWQNVELDEEGFNNYLDWGYSILERTPIKNVFFMRYWSTISLSMKSGSPLLSHVNKEDPPQMPENRDPETILNALKNEITKKEKMVMGQIIVPTSGGYDSRLLNYLIKDKQRIKAFTYGVSKKQEESIESVKAKRVSEILGVNWKRIELGTFNGYAKEWFALFGCSTHLHGMYHIEFYKKIRETGQKDGTLLSGIIGDLWAGSVAVPKELIKKDLRNLSYSHGMNFDSRYSLVEHQHSATEAFRQKYGSLFSDPRWAVLTLIRFKLLLLSYLLTIPEYLGYPAWTPFLNRDICLGMLNLDPAQRKNRLWQKDFFKKIGLNVEDEMLTYSKENLLNWHSLSVWALDWLNEKLLSSYVDPNSLSKVNESYSRLVNRKDGPHTFRHKLSQTRIGAAIKRRIGREKNFLEPYYQVLTLKSIEMALELGLEKKHQNVEK